MDQDSKNASKLTGAAGGDAEWRRMLDVARAGSIADLGRLLEHARSHLRRIAAEMTPRDLQSLFDASDLVQETLYEARQAFAEFRGSTAAEWQAWLTRILVHNVLNQYRRHRGTQMRDRRREVSLDEDAASWQELEAPDSTPSKAAMRREAAEIVRRNLDKLSPDHRQILLLRHREGLSFPEIGERMGRTAGAARMLWLRAFDQLAQQLDGSP